MKYIKGLIWILIAVALVVGAVVLVKRKKDEMAKIASEKVYKIVVNTMTLKKENITLTLPYLATIQSNNNVVISTKVTGRILSIVKTGDKVKKGQSIVKIDDNDLKAKLDELKLNINSININIDAKKLILENALQTHKRTKELLDVKGASIEQYQNEQDKIATIKAGIDVLYSNLKIIKAKMRGIENLLGYANLKAPFSGVVSKAFANSGDMAMPGRPLISLQSAKGKFLLLNLPSSQKVKEIIYDGKKYKTIALHSTFNGLDQYKVPIVTNANIGERVNIKVVTFSGLGIKIPLNALLQIGSKDYIFLAQNGAALQTPVSLIASGEEGFVINKYNNKKIVLAKPDIFLKLISGLKIKEQ